MTKSRRFVARAFQKWRKPVAVMRTASSPTKSARIAAKVTFHGSVDVARKRPPLQLSSVQLSAGSTESR